MKYDDDHKYLLSAIKGGMQVEGLPDNMEIVTEPEELDLLARVPNGVMRTVLHFFKEPAPEGLMPPSMDAVEYCETEQRAYRRMELAQGKHRKWRLWFRLKKEQP